MAALIKNYGALVLLGTFLLVGCGGSTGPSLYESTVKTSPLAKRVIPLNESRAVAEATLTFKSLEIRESEVVLVGEVSADPALSRNLEGPRFPRLEIELRDDTGAIYRQAPEVVSTDLRGEFRFQGSPPINTKTLTVNVTRLISRATPAGSGDGIPMDWRFNIPL